MTEIKQIITNEVTRVTITETAVNKEATQDERAEEAAA